MSQVILNICVSASLFLCLSLSFSLIYNSTKFFHLAHGVIITLSPYFTFLFVNRFSAPLELSILIGISLATCTGICCEYFIYRRMRKKNVPFLSYLIASIGLYVIFQNCISLFFGNDTKIINTALVAAGHQLFGAYITTIQIATICVSIVLFIGVTLILKYTSIGKALRAVANNSTLSSIYGVSSNKIILLAFAIGSGLAAIAGTLSAMDTNMTPTFGFNLLLYGIVVIIIGGVGSTKGLIMGSLFLASAQHLIAYCIDTKWTDSVTYVILISFLIWKPLGFSGNRLKKIEV